MKETGSLHAARGGGSVLHGEARDAPVADTKRTGSDNRGDREMGTQSRSAALPVLLGLMLGILATPRFAAAEWPLFGRAVCAEPGDQVTPSIATDGHDGAII